MLPALVLFALVQGTVQVPAAAGHDRTHDLVLAPDVDGASAGVTYRAEFSGRVFVRTLSETVDVHLALLDEGGVLLVEDRDEGPRRSTGVRVKVEPGRIVGVRVTALATGAPAGTVRLELVASPESASTLAAAGAARPLLDEAQALAAAGDEPGARAALARAFEILATVEGGSTSHEVDSVLSKLTLSAFQLGALPLARSAQSRVLAWRERTLPVDHPVLLATRSNYGNVLQALGELDEAGQIFAEVHDGLERTLPADHPDLLRSRQNLAVIARGLGDVPRSLELSESALAGFERTLGEDHPSTVEVRLNLAAMLREAGDFHGALTQSERVLAAYESTLHEDAPELRTARANAAVMLHDMGDFGAARALFERVLASCERTLPEDHPELLDVRQNLALTLRAMGDLAATRALEERVLAARERALPEEHPALQAARQNLAITLYGAGLDAESRELIERVLAARERTLPADHRQLLEARGNLAVILWKLGERERALELFRSVLDGLERTLPADHESLCTVRRFGIELLTFSDPTAAHALASAQVEGLVLRAQRALRLAPREAREAAASDTGSLAQALFVSESGTPDLGRRVFELIETRRLVAEETARAAGLAAADGQLDALARDARAARARLGDLIASAERSDAQPEVFAAELDRLSVARDVAERQIARALAERGVAAHGIDAGALARALPVDSAAVGFLRYPRITASASEPMLDSGTDHLLAHVLRADGTLTRVELGPARELESTVEAWRAALGRPLAGRGIGPAAEEAVAATATDLGARLGARLLAPLLAAAGAGVTTLLVCPDDLVYLVPLDALPLADGTVAGDRLRIAAQPSFARLLRQPESRAAGAEASLLVVGGVDYDTESDEPAGRTAHALAPALIEARLRGGAALRHAPLPATSVEARAIAELFRAAHGREGLLLDGARAGKAAFAGAVPGARYVHLATHGWFAPETVRSVLDAEAERPDGLARLSAGERVTGFAPLALCGLALAGANRGPDALGRVPGILTAEELTALDLSGCRLAVLSACETNVGLRRAGQGIQSLQTALHAAGARTAITSLWKVDDAATRALMERFYTYLWSEKQPAAEALWRAKCDLRVAGHPLRDWAPWVLTGALE